VLRPPDRRRTNSGCDITYGRSNCGKIEAVGSDRDQARLQAQGARNAMRNANRASPSAWTAGGGGKKPRCPDHARSQDKKWDFQSHSGNRRTPAPDPAASKKCRSLLQIIRKRFGRGFPNPSQRKGGEPSVPGSAASPSRVRPDRVSRAAHPARNESGAWFGKHDFTQSPRGSSGAAGAMRAQYSVAALAIYGHVVMLRQPVSMEPCAPHDGQNRARSSRAGRRFLLPQSAANSRMDNGIDMADSSAKLSE